MEAYVHLAIKPMMNDKFRTGPRVGSFYGFEIYVNIRRILDTLESGETWGEMFITQPAVREVTVEYELGSDYVEYVSVNGVLKEDVIKRSTIVEETITHR